MFNLQGSELIIILLLALVVLGPEKLPEAMRRAGRAYSEIKKAATGFQSEFKSVMEEPMREARETADLLRDSADFTKLADGEREEKPKSAEMGDAPEPAPVDDPPFDAAEAPPAASTDGFDSLPDPAPPESPVGDRFGAASYGSAEPSPETSSDDEPEST